MLHTLMSKSFASSCQSCPHGFDKDLHATELDGNVGKSPSYRIRRGQTVEALPKTGFGSGVSR